MNNTSFLVSAGLFLVLASPSMHAKDLIGVQENDHVALTLSHDNFNRLYVEGDKITRLRFPEGAMSVENDEDGSVYLDVKDEKPFTLFISTQKGLVCT